MFVFPDSFFPIRQVTSGSMTNSPESATDRKCVTRALTSCNRPPERRWGWSAPRAARQEHEDRRDPGTAQAHPGVCPELDLQDRRCPASSTHHLEAYCECSVTHREHQENVLDRRIGKRAEAAEDTLPVLHPLEPSLHRHLGRSAGPRPHPGTPSASPRAAQSGTGATPRPVAVPPGAHSSHVRPRLVSQLLDSCEVGRYPPGNYVGRNRSGRLPDLSVELGR